MSQPQDEPYEEAGLIDHDEDDEDAEDESPFVDQGVETEQTGRGD